MTNFTNFLDFYATPIAHPSKEETLKKISVWIDESKYKPLDIINYEDLIYLEIYFLKDEEIQEKIKELKNIIYNNYKLRQSFIYKVIHNIRK